MIRLSKGVETGIACPVCHNKSVFSYKIYGLLHVYRYSIMKCEYQPCQWQGMYDKNK